MSPRSAVLGLTVTAMLAAAPAKASASTLAGIQLSVGRFTLHVYYNVVLDYPDQSDGAVRDPRAVLFAVAALVQANADRFAELDHDLVFELGMRTDSPGVFLSVEEDLFDRPGAGRKYARLGEAPVSTDLVGQIVHTVCDRYAKACAKPPVERLTLFTCPTPPCPGQLFFGAFPSTSLNQRFCLLPPVGAKSGGRAVTRQQMPQYFRPLD